MLTAALGTDRLRITPAVVTGDGGGAPTYAPYIKNKTAKSRKPPRPAARTGAAAAPKRAPATASQASPVAAPPVASGEIQRLRVELQRVNQEISRIARLTRPGSDAGRNSQLPEKQELLMQKQDLERKIRALSKS